MRFTRMDEVLKEIPRVREDMGYPPLVTPTSQIVGTQAVLNVLTGARYKSVTNEVKNYLLGQYGKAPGKINEQVKALVVGDAEVMTCRPADMLEDEMNRLKAESETFAQSEEDVLTYAMFPGSGQNLPAGAQRQHAQAGTAAFQGGRHGLPGALCAQRVQGHDAWRDLPHQAHR